VLLKNDGLLPLDRAKLKRIAVIGPNADSDKVLLGNYAGKPSHYFRHIHPAAPQPKLALCGFTRGHLLQNQTLPITLEIPAERFRYLDTAEKRYVVAAGNDELLVGGASDDIRLQAPFTIVAAK